MVKLADWTGQFRWRAFIEAWLLANIVVWLLVLVVLSVALFSRGAHP